MEIFGAFVTLFGAVFLFIGALGLLRMPDVFNRMQAGTKATTLGNILFLTGIGISHPSWFAKLVLLILFIVFTNPLSAHALARAAHFIGVKQSERTVKDDLAEDEGKE